MKFVFWQNVVSIHQSAFIKALAQKHEVTLVAAEELDAQRRSEKWSVPSMGNAKIIIEPSEENINKLLGMSDAQHIFSGINAYPMVYKAFKKAVKKGLPISVMAEPYEWAGLKGNLRRFMYWWLFKRFGKHIRHFFATGNMGIECYRKAGFPADKLHHWGYFTEQKDLPSNLYGSDSLPNLIFIGKIDSRKNILALVEAAKKHHELYEQFLILGTGPLEQELEGLIKGNEKIKFVGAVPNSEVNSYLQKSDLLVLPSLFDGWGAVVNEALSQGTRVLCSNRCGASVLLDDNQLGGTFNLADETDLERQLIKWLGYGKLSVLQRKEISNWAMTNISGQSAAKYFEEVEKTGSAGAPWITPPQLTNINIIFVGRLDCNKNIIPLLKQFDEFGRSVNKFTVVGDGPMMEQLNIIAAGNHKINVKGRLSNEESVNEMRKHDYLILPSLYDGWGAVVNEALSVGTRVLCSEACGASILLDGNIRGQAFNQKNEVDVIRKWINSRKTTDMCRNIISQWTSENISGKAAAKYFVDTIHDAKTTAPWLTSSE